MVSIRTHVDADQDILAPVVSTGTAAPLIPAEMVAHAEMVTLHTHAAAHHHTLALVVNTDLDISGSMHVQELDFQIEMGGSQAGVIPTCRFMHTIILDTLYTGVPELTQEITVQNGISGFTLLIGVHGHDSP